MIRTSILAVAVLVPAGLAGVWAFSDCCKPSAAKETKSCCAGMSRSCALASAVDASASDAIASPVTPAGVTPEVLLAAGINPEDTGSVKGKVTFGGAAPERKPLDTTKDPECAKAHPEIKVMDETVVVGADGGLANVFVWVKKGIEDKKFDPPAEPVVIDQRGCHYVPHVMGIQVGQKWKIVSSDPLMHNIHAYPRKSPQFNKGMTPGAAPIETEFKKDELNVKVACDVHTWMNAVVHVTKHPFFAVTNEKGEFEIKGLPAGDYTFEAIHESLGTQTADLKVGAKETKDQNFTFKPKA
ncbi:MAG TPA: carboxypeptidase regulatory-like domain-containing protein [Planctomycetota bacterium]|nr:carboxypeptidase regulatory-like domain-containing protein [Planctomycetota bacterium]